MHFKLDYPDSYEAYPRSVAAIVLHRHIRGWNRSLGNHNQWCAASRTTCKRVDKWLCVYHDALIDYLLVRGPSSAVLRDICCVDCRYAIAVIATPRHIHNALIHVQQGALMSATATMIAVQGGEEATVRSPIVKRKQSFGICYILLNIFTWWGCLIQRDVEILKLPIYYLSIYLLSAVIISLSSVIIEYKDSVSQSSLSFAVVILSLSCVAIAISSVQLILYLHGLCKGRSSNSATEIHIHVDPSPSTTQPLQQVNQHPQSINCQPVSTPTNQAAATAAAIDVGAPTVWWY